MKVPFWLFTVLGVVSCSGAMAQGDANAVMRHAAERAPFHLRQVQSYESEVYLKGTVRIGDLPNELRQQYGTPARRVADWVFLVESRNKVSFSAPNHYDQQVISLSSTLPENIKATDAVKLVTTNIYDPKSSDRISPLDPKAFSHYNFSYMGKTYEGERLIHRIGITPKKKTANVVSGHIDIIDGTWAVNGFDFQCSEPGMVQHFTAGYEEVRPEVFLPTVYDIDMQMTVSGVQAFAQYQSTAEYRQVNVAETEAPAVAAVAPVTAVASIETEKAVMEPEVHVAVSPIAEEASSSVSVSATATDAPKFRPAATWGESVFDVVPEYNFVDGFWIGERIDFEQSLADGRHKFRLAPSLYFLTARKAVAWQAEASFRFGFRSDVLSHADFSVSGGDISADFSSEGESRLMNSFSSFLFGANRIRFYRKQFIETHERLTFTSGLSVAVGLSAEWRRNLENLKDFNLARHVPVHNSPLGDSSTLAGQTVSKLMLTLAYTPNDTRYPSFSFDYTLGARRRFDRKGMYDRLEVTLSQAVTLPQEAGEVDYLINAGKFLHAEKNAYPDYKHFRSNDWYVAGNASLTAFHLLENYLYATNNRWLQAHLEFYSRNLLLSRLPFVELSEGLHLRTLQLRGWNHSEAGYSVTFAGKARVGVYVALREKEYYGTSFSIELPLNR